MILRCEQRAVRHCLPLMLYLHRHRDNMVIARSNKFHRGWPGRNSAGAAVEADTVDRCGIGHHHFRVGSVDHGDIHICHRTVVSEDSFMPIASRVPDAGIAESIAHPSVESDMAAPISFMPYIDAVGPAPVARRPQQPLPRGKNPDSRHPIVAVIAIRPIAGNPQVSGCGTLRLIVDRQRRGRYLNGNSHRDLGRTRRNSK